MNTLPMPTENRSSNTEMVSVPRMLTREMLNGVCMHPDLARSLWAALLKNAPHPAEHQGEPVALPERKVHHLDPSFLPDGDKGWNACLDEIAKLGPLYPRPVQDEPVAIVDEGDEGLFVDLIYGDNGNPLRRGDRLYSRPAPADPGEVERLRAALKFYADREHYHFESGNWDTVSGEPLNILWCGDEPDFIEDGSVARAVLSTSAEQQVKS